MLDPKRAIAVIALSLSVLAAPSEAAADDESGIAWGAVAGEVSIAGVFALNFLVDEWPKDGPAFAVNFAPILIIPGVGIPAQLKKLDPRPAYAVHGAVVVGLDFFLMGTLIDSADSETDSVQVGPAAVGFGALGAALGGYWGATKVNNLKSGRLFFIAPIGLGVAGLVFGGLAALAVPESNRQARRVVIGSVAGLSVGLVGSAVLSRGQGPRRSQRRAVNSKLPWFSASRERVVVGLGGNF